MRYSTVVCLDDLTRESYWQAKEFFYDIVRLPAFHAAGLDIGKSPRRGQRNNLLPGFSADQFLALCQGGRDRLEWQSVYWELPPPAADYLRSFLPAGALVIGYEMPAWLRKLVGEAGLTWLDMRMSPLRFASDLYVALDTNCAELHARLHPHAQTLDEVFCEASLVAAQVRLRQRHEPAAAQVPETWVYIGQTVADASLIKADGQFTRINEYIEPLRALIGSARLLYKPHPGAGEFAVVERELIEAIVEKPVPVCGLETYEMLAGEKPLKFVGLSSGVLQEAQWFGKTAVSLAPPICVPGFSAEHQQPGQYLQIASHEFLSEPLWASALNPDNRREKPLRLPARANHLRELHNTWWGFATHTARHSDFYRQLFALHGRRGAAEDGGSAELRRELAAANDRIGHLQHDIDGLKEGLRVLLRQFGARGDTAAEPMRRHG